MSESPSEWKKITVKILRFVRGLFYIAIIALLITGIFTYWRDVRHYRMTSAPLTTVQRKILNALNIEIPANEFIWNYGSENGIIVQYGIIKNCHFQTETYRKCEVPKKVGFVGDTAIAVLLSITVAFCVISFILSIASIHYPYAECALIVTHLIFLGCAFAGILISMIYRYDAYLIDENYNTVSFPLQIKFGTGFDVTFIAFSIICMLISLSTWISTLSSQLQQQSYEPALSSNSPNNN